MASDPALAADVFARCCESRRTMLDITGRWGILVLVALGDGTHRFGELRRRIDGVSERMLSQTLQQLERDGFVARDVRATVPPHVEYRLTELGSRFSQHLRGLIELVQDAMPEVIAAQERYDRAH